MPAYTHEKVRENDLLPVRFEIVRSPSLTITAHWHEYLEILYILSGRMTAVIQAETFSLSPGDILIINSRDIHMTQTTGGQTDYLLLQLSTDLLRRFLVNFDFLRFDTCIPKKRQDDKRTSSENNPVCTGKQSDPFEAAALSGTAAACLREMMRIYETQETGYPLLFTSRLYELLYILYRNHSVQLTPDSAKSTRRDFLRIVRITGWIDHHYQEPLGLDQAAAYLNLSREYFCRIFKKYTGQTFLEYLNDIRASKLYREMMDSDESITSLMEKHGITNYKIFLRTFKKLYGDVPQKIRKKAPDAYRPGAAL